jgi:peptidoglycan hydrolase-like protein with peptidoglycan-binding domain
LNKKLKSISCILAATCTFLVVENTIKVGPLAVDVVSAATGEATTTTTTTTSTSKTTSTSTSTGYLTRLLLVGTSGSDVKNLQTALNSNGASLKVDGFFGQLTKTAVMNYQKAHSLAADGIVGPKTMAVLVPRSTIPTSIVKTGTSSADVKYLQTNLNKLGYKLTADGIFGKLTLAAVKDFQKANGLAVDGIAGPNTFGKLYDKVNATATTTPTTPPTTTTTTPTTPVDTVTSASQVNDEATFIKNVTSTTSDYMQIVNKDLTFTNDIVVVPGLKAATATTAASYSRSIAPAAEDSSSNITKRFIITIPNLVFVGDNQKIEYGIVKGDIYVNGNGFKLKDARIDGNLYFATDAEKSAFVQDATTTINGEIAVKAYVPGVKPVQPQVVDTVASASRVNDEATFVKNVTDPNSSYMQIVNKSLTFTSDIKVVSGTKPASTNTTTGVVTPAAPNRSIAPCAEAKDSTGKNIVTKRFIITVPNIVFSGVGEKIEYGIVKGNVYVQTTGFTLSDSVIDGNLYFANQDLLNTYMGQAKDNANKTIVNGVIAVKAYN